jgi:hypothetical protein
MTATNELVSASMNFRETQMEEECTVLKIKIIYEAQ